MEYGRGERLLQQGRAGDAEKVFRALLSRLEGDADYDTRYDQGRVLRNLGLCMRAQGRTSQAVDFYQRAISLAEKLDQDKTVKQVLGVRHTDLADALAELGQYAAAQKEYENGLTIAKEIDDGRQQGVALGQLGTLAMTQGDLNEARKRYHEALSLFQRMGEDQSEALVWGSLGNLASEAKDWDEAERCLKQSYSIFEAIGDDRYTATACNQLATVAVNAGRPQEAERWYLRAIELGEKLNLVGELGKWLSNLASLYLSQNHLDKAETYARRALAIVETLDLSSEPWKTYSLLAELAEKRGRMDEVREWRRKEQESFAAFAGSDTQIKQFEPLIAAIVAACQANQEALAQVESVLQKMENGGNEDRAFAKSVRRLLAGESDVVSLSEGLNRNGGLIIRRILQALNGEQTEDGGRKTVLGLRSTVSPSNKASPCRNFSNSLSAPRKGIKNWAGSCSRPSSKCRGMKMLV
jgi:tetratricopeptide (TPR) repeat protein